MPMVAELPPLLLDVGTVAGIIIAVAGALGLLSKAPPVRWVWRQLIGDPVTRWQAGVVKDQIAPLRTEVAELRLEVAESSTDLITHVRAEEALRVQDIADRDRRQSEADARWDNVSSELAATREDVGEVKAGLGTVHRRIDSALTRLAAGNPEVRP